MPASGLAQRAETRLVLGFLALDEPDTLTQDLAGILVAARRHQLGDQVRLMIGEHDVARGHRMYPQWRSGKWHIMPIRVWGQSHMLDWRPTSVTAGSKGAMHARLYRYSLTDRVGFPRVLIGNPRAGSRR